MSGNMANKHRAKALTRDDFDKPWKLKFFRNPAVKVVVVKCAICEYCSKRHPKGKRKPMP